MSTLSTDRRIPSLPSSPDEPPPRFAGGPRPERAELLAAPIRWPRPSRLRARMALAPGRMAEGAAALGIGTVGDLLEHFPRDRRPARTIGTLAVGEQATLIARVCSIRARAVRRARMRPLVEATVEDGTGSLRATFFNQPWLVQRYPPGTVLMLHGRREGGNRLVVSHHAISDSPTAQDEMAGTAQDESADVGVAHYPATEGLSSTQILALVAAHRNVLSDVVEPLPARLRIAHGLPDRVAAVTALHYPASSAAVEIARRRVAFEELLVTQLRFLRSRAARARREGALALADPPTLTARWLREALPFDLTGDQRRAIDAVQADLARTRPTQRLLMGEVGSGKTVIALHAMLRAAEHGCQAALMAPTETLAEQHHETIQRLLGAESVSLALLTGSTPPRRRREILARLASGELSLVVGTHALIDAGVSFRRLALTIVDEQHRFGVRQRSALAAKARAAPHALHMTATPIPRTLALLQYGDLDVTTLHELPGGRGPVRTRIVSGARERAAGYEELRAELRAGRQAFVVCPLVEEDGEEEEGHQSGGTVRAARAELERLAAGELADFRLQLLHGQMPASEKRAAMSAFAGGVADVLVATTVIEVGIDVPAATMILVENAERYGISQLHQLRGRVGRGAHGGTCLLLGPRSSPRLRALAKHSDGFRLAEIDLELRREGDLLGTRQSGLADYRLARLPGDRDLLEAARAAADAILEDDPWLREPEHALLASCA